MVLSAVLDRAFCRMMCRVAWHWEGYDGVFPGAVEDEGVKLYKLRIKNLRYFRGMIFIF